MDDETKLSLPSGLPPLPKSLTDAICFSESSSTITRSGNISPLLTATSHTPYQTDNDELFLGASTSAAARKRHSQSNRHGSLSSTQESLSDRESIQSRASSTHSSHQHTPTNNGNGLSVVSASPSSSNETPGAQLNNQLALLKREMYGLRQLDLNLLSQLWALNESIQGFRVFLQEQDALSPPSPSSPTDSNSLTSEGEDESFAAAMPKRIPASNPKNQLLGGCGSTTSHASTSSASGTSGSSSAASSMSKQMSQLSMHRQQHPGLQKPLQPPPPHPNRSHPQLPRILQQRMRRAPPPPPPPTTRPKSLTRASPTASIMSAQSSMSSPSAGIIGMTNTMATMQMPTISPKQQRPV